MNRKRILALVLAMMLAVAATPALAQAELPFLAQPQTFTAMVAYEASNLIDWNEKPYYKKLSEETNVFFDFVTLNDWSTQTKLAIASNELPDVFMGQISNMDDNLELFWDLTDLIPQYAPSLAALYEQEPAILAGSKSRDGRIYTLQASATWTLADAIGSVFWINQKWLDAVGMKNPTNLEELYAVLIAFRDGDPNGNGIADEIPMSFCESYWAGKMGDLFGPFGVLYSTDTYVQVDDAGKVLFQPQQQGFYEGLKWLNKLCAENLLDQEGFSQTGDQYKAKISQDMLGVCVRFDPRNYCDAFVPLNPILNAEGTTMVGGVKEPGAAKRISITKKCEHPEAILQYYEYINCDQLRKLTERYGEKGVYWDFEGEGPQYVTHDYDSQPPTGYEFWDQYLYSMGGTGYNCFNFISVKEQANNITPLTMRDEGVQKLMPYFCENVFHKGALSEQESSELNMLYVEIDAYTQNFVASAVFEGIDDAKWQAHLDACKALQVERYTQLRQQSNDAYLSLLK
ncbi:MAG: hypothetical protein RR865_12210 [Clostridia bacterium]